MTVKLLLLKSGEDIISDVQEMVTEHPETGEKRVIGYFLTKPCVVKLRDASLVAEENNKKASKYNITMYPWIPLTHDKVIPLTAEWVITMVNPADQVKKMYEEDILPDGNTNQNSSFSEQSDSDQSD
jgi:hypothetical protein